MKLKTNKTFTKGPITKIKIKIKIKRMRIKVEISLTKRTTLKF